VLELRKPAKASSKPRSQVKLASATTTFHPQVWIIDGLLPPAIAGSAGQGYGYQVSKFCTGFTFPEYCKGTVVYPATATAAAGNLRRVVSRLRRPC